MPSENLTPREEELPKVLTPNKWLASCPLSATRGLSLTARPLRMPLRESVPVPSTGSSSIKQGWSCSPSRRQAAAGPGDQLPSQSPRQPARGLPFRPPPRDCPPKLFPIEPAGALEMPLRAESWRGKAPARTHLRCTSPDEATSREVSRTLSHHTCQSAAASASRAGGVGCGCEVRVRGAWVEALAQSTASCHRALSA